MQTFSYSLQTEEQKKALIAEVERAYDAQMECVLPKIVSAKEEIFTLSGPSCSGKTTTAHQMLDAFSHVGKRVAVVSIDDFFYPREHLLQRQKESGQKELDYDSLAALDFPYFCACADRILQKQPTDLPKYDFVSGQRSGYTELLPASYDAVLFEGIQAIYPEITARLRQVPVCEVSIGVREDVAVNGVFFDKREIRLMRRTLRDYRKRAASPEFTFYLWNSVSQNEEKNILPYEEEVQIRISSFLPYEIFVLKDPLSALLQTIPSKSAYYKTAQQLLEKLAPLPSIPESYVPKESLFWEFL